ncbi:MAG: helix-turn-helix domain-containing protein [Chloroflexi bacterium]|nr:helix-turn-helix domain-containing protein [Chloroflexota bacterium]
MKNKQWAKFVKRNREKVGLSRRKLAQKASIDPSYITLIENDGYIPSRNKVVNLAEALEINNDRALLEAGYLPDKIDAGDMWEIINIYHRVKEINNDVHKDTTIFSQLEPSGQDKYVREFYEEALAGR